MAVVDDLLADARRRKSLPAPVVRRLLREQAGLTQREVATALAVSRPAVTRWESGARSPRGELSIRYAELLDRLAKESAWNG